MNATLLYTVYQGNLVFSTAYLFVRTKAHLHRFENFSPAPQKNFRNSKRFLGNPREIPKIEKVPAGTRERLGCTCLVGACCCLWVPVVPVVPVVACGCLCVHMGA